MKTLLVLSLLFGLMATACAPAPEESSEESSTESLADRLLIVDTHIDLPYRLESDWEDISQRSERGDFDYPRAREGGLNLPFMSIYIPADLQGTGEERPFADRTIDMVEELATAHPDKFRLVYSTADAEGLVGDERIGLALGMENGAPIDDLDALQHYYDRGIRYITLTHSENNLICDSSYADDRKWDGLSDYGKEVIAEMNRLGIMIDVSHVSDAAFEQILDLTTVPVIASHSSLRHFTPNWERNLSDEMVKRIGENGGVVQINFGSSFIRGDSQQQGSQFWQAMGAYAKENNLKPGDEALQAWQEAYWSDREKIYADLSDVVDHIDRVVDLAGIDHVGIGSDYDGVGDSLPTGLKDVSAYPNLLNALAQRGYTEEEIAKIAGGNLMRVWRDVEAAAAH